MGEFRRWGIPWSLNLVSKEFNGQGCPALQPKTMTCITNFTVGGISIPAVPTPAIWYHEARGWPKSTIYFCRKCGGVYATAEVLVNGHQQDWTSHTGLCEECVDPHSLLAVPGSIWSPGIHPERNAILPRLLLLREFKLHEEWYDKRNQ